MARLSPQQITQYAYNAGFRGAALQMAVAIALAESGGDPAAYNPETAAGTRPGNGSRGLWQIYGTAHPQYNNDSAFDPATNAQAAYQVYKEAGNRFTPWSTYNVGMAQSIINNGLKVQSPTQVTNSGRGSQAMVASMGGTSSRLNGSQFEGVRSGSGAGANESGGSFLDNLNPVESLRAWITGEGNPDPHPSTLYDFSAMGIGGVLILIGVIMLLFGALNNDTVKGLAKSAVKIAAI